MKKYLFLLLLVMLSLMVSCRRDEEEEPVDPEKIVASHDHTALQGPQYSYIITKGKLEDNQYSTSMTFYHTLKSTVTNRSISYFQVDYTNSNHKQQTYFHTFGIQDGKIATHSQNFFPYLCYDNSSQMKTMSVLVKFAYVQDGVTNNKEEKYQEEIIVFDESKYNREFEANHFLMLVNNTKENESYYRYKIYFVFDDKIYIDGHFDFQTWFEYGDGQILPFIGGYHYPVLEGVFAAGSDEKIAKNGDVKNIYWEIRHINSDGTVSYQYYKESV